jgi:hypothetical protein
MQVDLQPDEIEMLIEGLDHYKTRIAFTKGGDYAAKTAKLQKADDLADKLRAAAGS